MAIASLLLLVLALVCFLLAAFGRTAPLVSRVDFIGLGLALLTINWLIAGLHV